jgi:hypothetical protein
MVVTGSATSYDAVNLTATIAALGPFTIIGPGRNASPTAKIAPAAGQAVSVTTSGTSGAILTVDGLELIGAGGGAPQPGVQCNQSGTNTATLAVINSNVHGSGQQGVYSTGCVLTLDSNLINANTGGGVRVATTTFTITNNIIGQNGTGVPGVRIDDNPAGSVFAFNTVAGNGGAASGIAGGVQCNAATTLQASIVANNSTSGTGTQFGGSCTLQKVVVGTGDSTADAGAIKLAPSFVSASDFHLVKNDAANAACCVDQLAAPTTPNHAHDVDATTRPKGTSATPYDVGAHEVQ